MRSSALALSALFCLVQQIEYKTKVLGFRLNLLRFRLKRRGNRGVLASM
jgi:hypothetical protein